MRDRKSIRLKSYDYSQPGMYFVTICVEDRQSLFGSIVANVGAGPCARPEMAFNDRGQMINKVWMDMPNYYPGIILDSYIVMPNHFHGIIGLNLNQGHPRGGAPTLGLPDVVHRFKSLTTTRYRKGVKNFGWPRFFRKLWQRNYYERVIRNEKELFELRQYIQQNPLKWELDPENPVFDSSFVGAPGKRAAARPAPTYGSI